MKNFLMVLLLLCTISTPAWALDYTGNNSELNDALGYYPSSHGIWTSTWIGGPIGNNTLGEAEQFTVSDTFSIDKLYFDADVWDDAETPRVLPVTFKLYEGSLLYRDNSGREIPNINNILAANTYGFEGPTRGGATLHYEDASLPFSATFVPGTTYFLAMERHDSGPIVSISDIALVHNPEPSTLGLFGIGALLLRRRRANRA